MASPSPLELWDLQNDEAEAIGIGQASDRKETCKLRLDLLPLLRLLRPRLLSSTLVQLPSLMTTIPKHSQAREPQELAPNYANVEAWSAHPARMPGRAVEDVNHLKFPDEANVVPPKLRPCDCFFVHDSTLIPAVSLPFGLPPRWNAPLREPKDLVAKINEQTDLRVAAGAAPFNRLCRVYAPRYRQVNVMCIALMMPPSPFAKWKQLEQALELAYQDLRSAFLHFLQTRGADRPFFIAGHSQGTMHLTRLVQEEIDPYPSRAQRFLHGYLAGQTVPLSIFQQMKHVRPSQSPTDLCSISSWRTAPPGVLVVVICGLIFHAGKGWKKLQREILATNPITWRSGTSPSSKANEYLGAAFPLPRNMQISTHQAWPVSGVALRFGHRAKESVELLGCEVKELSRIDCGKIAARVDRTGATRVPKLPNDCWFTLAEDDFLRYHDLDMALFFGNLRANCEQRYRASLPRGRL